MTAAAPRGVFVGLATLDCVYRVPATPGPDQKITALSQELAAGGPAANAAITFALLGGDAVLVTDLGTHPLAVAVRQDLESHGVSVIAVDPRSERSPAVSSVYVSDRTGQRSVVSVNAELSRVQTPDWLQDVVPAADIVLIDGHHPSLAVASAAIARINRVPVLLDAGSYKPVLDHVLTNVDIAVCSADLRFRGFSEPSDIADVITAFGVRRLAITRGPEPIRWWEGVRSGALTVPSVTVRDTLAAGDVLHGAVAYELASGTAFVSALARGAALASRKCSVFGAAAWRAGITAQL